MNKYKLLIKQTVRLATLCGIISAVVIGLMIGVGFLESGVEERLKTTEKKLSDDKNLLSSLRKQLDQSGDAEKRFLAMMEQRSGSDFSAKIDNFKAWLRDAKDRYHFQISDKVSTDVEALSDRPELVNLEGYNIYVRPHFSFEFKAPSDLHVFSFVRDIQRSAPALIRIDKVQVSREQEMTDAIINSMRTGSIATLVDAKIEISLIGVRVKEEPKNDPKAVEAQKK